MFAVSEYWSGKAYREHFVYNIIFEFSQILDEVPWQEIHKCLEKYLWLTTLKELKKKQLQIGMTIFIYSLRNLREIICAVENIERFISVWGFP